MTRHLLAALFATASLALPAHAQYADPRDTPLAMPGYDDGEPAPPAGYDSYGTADARANGDPRDAAPPPPRAPRPPQGNAGGYGSDNRAYAGGGYDDGYNAVPPPEWHQPAPYKRADQVDEGRADDEAHRADRAYTASLNQRRWPGRNEAPVTRDTQGNGNYAAEHARYQAELADHARQMRAYQDEQARYADHMARWREQADACRAGDTYACGGSE